LEFFSQSDFLSREIVNFQTDLFQQLSEVVGHFTPERDYFTQQVAH